MREPYNCIMKEECAKNNSFKQGALSASHGEWPTASQKGVDDKLHMSQGIELFLTSLDSQSRGQGTVVAPWGSCHCTGGTVAPDTWSPAAVTGSTGPS